MRQVLKGHFGAAVVISFKNHPTVTPDQLTESWVVNIQSSKNTIKATTQVDQGWLRRNYIGDKGTRSRILGTIGWKEPCTLINSQKRRYPF